jgi:hypothetical protein
MAPAYVLIALTSGIICLQSTLVVLQVIVLKRTKRKRKKT